MIFALSGEDSAKRSRRDLFPSLQLLSLAVEQWDVLTDLRARAEIRATFALQSRETSLVAMMQALRIERYLRDDYALLDKEEEHSDIRNRIKSKGTLGDEWKIGPDESEDEAGEPQHARNQNWDRHCRRLLRNAPHTRKAGLPVSSDFDCVLIRSSEKT